MVDKVNDNHNEVLRGAAEVDSTDSKYNLRVSVENSQGKPALISKSDAQLLLDNADFRLMISYQSKILEQLEKLNRHMEIITEEENI